MELTRSARSKKVRKSLNHKNQNSIPRKKVITSLTIKMMCSFYFKFSDVVCNVSRGRYFIPNIIFIQQSHTSIKYDNQVNIKLIRCTIFKYLFLYWQAILYGFNIFWIWQDKNGGITLKSLWLYFQDFTKTTFKERQRETNISKLSPSNPLKT